jgi:hypothetical protein
VETFIGRFLHHVLPKGFVKVRYYGLFRLANRHLLARIRGQLLLVQRTADLQMESDVCTSATPQVLVCPICGQSMRHERMLLPHNRGPPSRSAQNLKHPRACGGADYERLSISGVLQRAVQTPARQARLRFGLRPPQCRCW